jgi:hypothetical protein
MQPLVNALARDGLVRLVSNRAHKRSPFVELTSRGKAIVDAIVHREAALRARLPMRVPKRDLRAAAEVLGAIRDALDSRVAPTVAAAVAGAAVRTGVARKTGRKERDRAGPG